MIERLGIPETGMLAYRTLPALMAPSQLLPGRIRDVDALLAWGRRPSARRVERLAQRCGLPVWHVGPYHTKGSSLHVLG